MIEGKIYVNSRSANPTTDEVFTACKGCYAKPCVITVSFWVQMGSGIGQKVAVTVRKIDHESGTPGVLLLEGYLQQPIDGHTAFDAFYDARDGHGTGHIKFFKSGEKKQ